MKKATAILIAWLIVFAQLCSAQQNALETTGKVSSVIVYRGQALVTRTIETDLLQGSTELTVQKLPENLVPESLYAQAGDGAVISSVRYREKTVKEEEREGVKQINEQIEELQRQIKHTDRDRKHLDNIWQRYDPLWTFTLNTANADVNRGLLQFEPIEKTTGYLEDKFNTIHKSSLELEDKLDDLNKELNTLKEQKEKLLAGTSRVEREAALLVKSEKAGKTVIELSYLVRNAGWLPQYSLRATPSESSIFVEYNAIIHQSSGEDWNNVQLSLSTAEPATEATPPELKPMKIGLGPAGPQRQISLEKSQQDVMKAGIPYQSEYRDMTQQFQEIQTSRRNIIAKGKAAQAELNTVAAGNQMLELAAEKEDVTAIQRQAKRFARTEGVSVVYDLGKGFTMPDRCEQQLATIAAFQSKAQFTMTAAPLLTDYVYLRADVTNNSNTILLAGPANMYRDGEFVGKGAIELVTIGEKFTVGFGVDSQIQITREFKDKKVDTLWGKRVERYDYRLAVNNYKNTIVKLRLTERIPYTEDQSLAITEFTTNIPLSTDAEYLRKERDKGILRWDIELAPLTAEDKATVITYSYTIKYDNDNMRTKIVP